MMRDIGACFCYAQKGFDNVMKQYIERISGSLPYQKIKTITDNPVGLSSLVVQGLNCFFYNYRRGMAICCSI